MHGVKLGADARQRMMAQFWRQTDGPNLAPNRCLTAHASPRGRIRTWSLPGVQEAARLREERPADTGRRLLSGACGHAAERRRCVSRRPAMAMRWSPDSSSEPPLLLLLEAESSSSLPAALSPSSATRATPQ